MLKGRPNTARGKERNAVLEKGKMVKMTSSRKPKVLPGGAGARKSVPEKVRL